MVYKGEDCYALGSVVGVLSEIALVESAGITKSRFHPRFHKIAGKNQFSNPGDTSDRNLQLVSL